VHSKQVQVDWGTSIDKAQFTTTPGSVVNTTLPLASGEKHEFRATGESQERQQIQLQGKTATVKEDLVQPGVIREKYEQDVLLRKEGLEVETPKVVQTTQTQTNAQFNKDLQKK